MTTLGARGLEYGCIFFFVGSTYAVPLCMPLIVARTKSKTRNRPVPVPRRSVGILNLAEGLVYSLFAVDTNC